jgi:hypothetical protein
MATVDAEQAEKEQLDEVDYQAFEAELIWLDSVVRQLPPGAVVTVGRVSLTREAARAELGRFLAILRDVELKGQRYEAALEHCRRAMSGPKIPQA